MLTMDMLATPSLKKPILVPAPTPEAEERLPFDGVVKWFNIQRGFGFLEGVGEAYAPFGDVFFHATVLRDFGLGDIRDGQRVLAEIARYEKGWRVRRISAMSALDGPAPQDGDGTEPGGDLPVDLTDFEPIVVKWFVRIRGYGFATIRRGEDLEDVFIHARVLRRAGLYEVSPGDRLIARIERETRGLSAVEVHIDPEALRSVSPQAEP
jgi:CspA family cold shock protein